MSRVISVVTAAYAPVPEYLTAAYRSLRDQQLPAGWEWQWVVQQDGHCGDVAAILPADQRISLGRGRRAGAAVTRTMCLSRAAGELIKFLTPTISSCRAPWPPRSRSTPAWPRSAGPRPACWTSCRTARRPVSTSIRCG